MWGKALGEISGLEDIEITGESDLAKNLREFQVELITSNNSQSNLNAIEEFEVALFDLSDIDERLSKARQKRSILVESPEFELDPIVAMEAGLRRDYEDSASALATKWQDDPEGIRQGTELSSFEQSAQTYLQTVESNTFEIWTKGPI